MKMWIWTAVFIFVAASPLNINGRTAVLILARGGSKGIPLKNLRKVGNSSLLARAINTVKRAELSDITISTNHILIALEAWEYGAKVLHRSFITATDTAPSIWGAAEFISQRPDVNILVLVQATSPFIRPIHLQIALNKFEQRFSIDCVFSVVRSNKLRWLDINDKITPVNFNINARPRRQDWNGELLETGAFYITRRHLIEKGYFQNDNCTFVEVSKAESLEVDSYYDLQVANALLNSNLVT